MYKMTIRDELIEILKDATTVDQVLKITGGKLSPQQRYMQSDKGKEARRRANAAYQAKPKEIDNEAARRFLQHLNSQEQGEDVRKPLTHLWIDYKDWTDKKPVTRAEFKKQLTDLAIPIERSYVCPVESKRVYQPAYQLGRATLKSLFD